MKEEKFPDCLSAGKDSDIESESYHSIIHCQSNTFFRPLKVKTDPGTCQDFLGTRR